MLLLLGIYANTVQWLEQHMLRCPSKMLLKIDCPGCGLQRGILAMLKGNWAESFQIYPATLPILVMFAYLLLHLLFKFKNGARNLSFIFMFCAGIILVHYIYKIVTHQNF
jgi:Protein of unknown function (DUF2752)